MLDFIDKWYSRVSFEHLLEKRANGGTIIFVRTLCISGLLSISTLAARNFFDPDLSWRPSWAEFRRQSIALAPYFAACFAGVYAALYARFASQWSYLAGVFNEIKSAQVQGQVDKDALNEWKAAFIEDAMTLHLVYKPEFASIVASWGGRREVKDCFDKNAPQRRKNDFASMFSEVTRITQRP